ncbi:unnamed protein product [Onchocerca flexuosa]|uniref:Uncharacterized protein n=1 Tax=Onchocerca flexuosa TaxID=387005 RepID=A0A183I2N2_9BILA|nr:unnamed protein product [Onchocerca flexuosa]
MDSQAQRVIAGCLVVDRRCALHFQGDLENNAYRPKQECITSAEAISRLTSGVTKPAVCSSPPRKTVGWTHYREPAPD